MSPETKLFGLIALWLFITAALYVLFGQITVRKLRNNPATKNALGFSFVSGWDIVNAAQALSWPSCLMKKLERGSLFAMYAKADLLREHTTKLDRILARLFYGSLILFGGSVNIFTIFKKFRLYGCCNVCWLGERSCSGLALLQ